MACIGQYTHKQTSLVIPNAYWRIMDVTGTKEDGYSARISIFCSEADRNVSLQNSVFDLPRRITAPYNAEEQPLITLYNKLKELYPHLTDHP